jgi:hypothetical protein
MNDLEQAKTLLQSGGYSCVLCKGGRTHTSTERGVLPLVRILSENTHLSGFSAADRIVGKAAALLFCLIGVKEVYAPVMSRAAVEVLSAHGILSSYDTTVETIVNREGTGACPMEQAVRELDQPEAALEAVKRTLAELAKRKEGSLQ